MRLIETLATTEKLSDLFGDASVLQAMLDFESALARAEARAGVISSAAAQAVEDYAKPEHFDAAELARQGLAAGTPAIPLTKMLTARAEFAHWGTTSQDLMDTALVLLLKRAREILAADHARLSRALRRIAEAHAGSVMLARTLLQPAPPITFGLKAAAWRAAIVRGWSRVQSRFTEAFVVQFGGASGTLAALDENGPAVADALAEELGLHCPDAPWHSHRDRLAALMAALGIYTASLGKMALDLSLLMQPEVAEAAEPGGGSSAMPHKRNPKACMLTLAAAHRTPGLIANYLAGMLQEHERAVGGWQAEWVTIADIIQAAGVAVESMADAAESLTVDPERMRRNIQATRGMVFAERAMALLAPTLGREPAHKLVEEASRGHRTLSEALAGQLTPSQLASLERPEDYLGSAEYFRVRLLAAEE